MIGREALHASTAPLDGGPNRPIEAPRTLLSVAGLSLRIGGVDALDDVSFDVATGELFAIIGPNGAGKTSLLNCLSGIYRPQRGRMVLDGVDLTGRRAADVARLGLGRTFQHPALFTHLDVVSNLLVGRHYLMRAGFLAGALWWGRAKGDELEHRRAVEEIIDLLALGPYRRTPVGVLPYGIQKRVELGRALAAEPRLLMLDEPVAGMNLEETEDMARQILEAREQRGVTMILVEHDMRLVMDLADRIMTLDFGQMIATGTPVEIRSDERVVRAYLGTSVR